MVVLSKGGEQPCLSGATKRLLCLETLQWLVGSCLWAHFVIQMLSMPYWKTGLLFGVVCFPVVAPVSYEYILNRVRILFDPDAVGLAWPPEWLQRQ